MTRDEARLLLHAHRPNDQDDANPLFAEAQAFVAADPELKAWWDAQQIFDRKVAAKLDAVTPPEHLRATLLGEGKITAFPSKSRLPAWFAVAALLALLMVALNLLPGTSRTLAKHEPLPTNLTPADNLPPGPGPALASSDYDATVLPYLRNNDPDLQMTSADREKVDAWLKERHSPTGSLPSNMATLPSVGCETLAVHGHAVSLICFTMANGKMAHLFVVEKKALNDPPPLASPQYSERAGGWSTAEWSDDSMSYILATQAGPDALKSLL